MCLFVIKVTIYMLENLEIILAKVSDDVIKSDILPFIFSTLESNSIQGHEAAISVFTYIRQYVDEQNIRKMVLPKAKALFNKTTNVRVSYCRENFDLCLHAIT